MSKILIFILLPIISFSQVNIAEVEVLFQNKQYEKAEMLLLNYLKNAPNNIQAKALLGDAYAYQKQWDKAIDTYENVLEKETKNAQYFYNYGMVLGMLAMENKLKAMMYVNDIKMAFITASELDKTHIDTRWALVHLYMKLPGIVGGSMTKALQYAEELEELSKVDGYLAKGFVYEYDDAFLQAETYYKKAVQVGRSKTCYLALFNLYEVNNKPDKAIETLEEAQQKHHQNIFQYQIGKVAAKFQIQLEKGKRNLTAYLENFKSDDEAPESWAHYRLAQIYRYQSNKSLALNHIHLGLKALPNQPEFKDEKNEILGM
ncbi:tetratricopeptide repeat protein [Pseudotamlana carrageenivorans]|uniref:Tetratricopeptide repeat protein n=1 Tax=Pseudotamlana carrageenivorans TaxID=2069432 RepID=A0A2I7SFN3_9FLAO|nr:tetratricopeptide repeat protein [Tamlana carrageenivorans]AUS04674.1 hypothetical protein C1A40_03925 [Tamlana carrageenivorans]